MNVYSIRLIPNLKLKLCEFFGIASSFAIDQLGERLQLLERKMENLDTRMKRPRKALVLPLHREAPKPSRKAKVKVSLPKPPRNKVIEQEVAPIVLEEAKTRLAAMPVEAEIQVVRKPLVFLIQPEDHTRQVAQDYFEDRVELIEATTLDGIEAMLSEHRVLAVLFDRGLLASEVDRQIMSRLKERSPEMALVGLSNYLTLAFSESLPNSQEMASFLTKPIDAEGLASVFHEQENRAIS